MKTEYVSSLGLPRGFRVSQYETADIAKLVADPKMLALLTDTTNKYLRQKSALVEGRDQLAAKIEALGFKPLLEKVKKTDAEGKVTEHEVWAETEGKFINRFIAAVRKGDFKAPGWTTEAAAVAAKLQELADQCGDLDAAGKPTATPPVFVLDIVAPERTTKERKPPGYAIDAANNIISKGSQKKWADTFTKEGISFEPFDVKDDAAGNVLRLAWAVKAREDSRSKKEYV